MATGGSPETGGLSEQENEEEEQKEEEKEASITLNGIESGDIY